MAYAHIPNFKGWTEDTAGLRSSPVNLAKLTPIDNLVRRYFGASESGKISILNSLQDEIAKQFSAVPQRPIPIKDLDDVAEVVLEEKQKLPGPRRWRKERATLNPLPNLAKIDDLVEKHRKAWSDEAKKNVIADLHLEIGKWLGANVGVYPVMTALQEKVRARLPKNPQIYSQVLCFAYVQDTSEYKNISMGDESHMRARCGELETAIKAAVSLAPVLKFAPSLTDPTVLKIFMAPEFFFRGRNGAYADYVFDKILPELNGRLKNMNTDLSHWLFVFGTAVKTAGRTYFCGTCHRHVQFEGGQYKCSVHGVVGPANLVQKAEAYNVALLQKGTWNHFVAKENVSREGRTDFGVEGLVTVPTVEGKRTAWQRMTGTGKPVTVPVVPPPGSRDSEIAPRQFADFVEPSTFDDERMGGAVFTLDGIRIGVEICVDHSQDVKRLEHAENVKIKLVPSEGMKIERSNPCVPGGIVFNVDGSYLEGQPGAQVWQCDPAKAVDKTGIEIKKFGGKARLVCFGPYVLP